MKKVKTKKKKSLKSLNKIPRVRARRETKENKDQAFPVSHYSPSSFVKFSTNPILYKIRYMNGTIFDSLTNASAILGQSFHEAMRVYNGGSDEHPITDESEAIREGLKAGMRFIDAYQEGFINWQDKIPNKEVLFEKFALMFNSYVAQHDFSKEEIINVEEKMESYIDVTWNGERVSLPVKLKGYPDLVVQDKRKRLVIRDYKTVNAYSKEDKIDGAKIIQALFYFFLVYVSEGRAPYAAEFEEVKHTKNKDGSNQVRKYKIVFKEHPLYFDFFFRFYDDITRALNGEMVFVPNFNDLFDNELAMIAYIHRLDDEKEVANK